MSVALLTDLTVFVLAVLVGFEVISKVPATLHTPLMSGANSIHGIILIGVMIIAGTAETTAQYILVAVAGAFAAANVVGGYLVTDRMLEMFRSRPERPKVEGRA
ncbi:MAG: NAD(P) transhydrogenase subunit alpha [Actinocatenispora sp.]